MPKWRIGGSNAVIEGFYEQPKGTLQTLILGGDNTSFAVNPEVLYTRYGMNAYNLSLEHQTLSGAWYWLQEAVRLHGVSLKHVVLDASLLETAEEAYGPYLDAMPMSRVKFTALLETTGSAHGVLTHLIPLLNNHNRWSTLTAADFSDRNNPDRNLGRGYRFTIEHTLLPEPETADEETVMADPNAAVSALLSAGVPEGTYKKPVEGGTFHYSTRRSLLQRLYALAAAPEPMAEDGRNRPDPAVLQCLARMADFCREKGLHLTVVQTPDKFQDADRQEMLLRCTEQAGVTLVDWHSGVPETDFDFVPDTVEGSTLNHFGAEKLTDALGSLLQGAEPVSDLRGLKGFAYLEEEFQNYVNRIEPAAVLAGLTDPADYLAQALRMPGCTVFLTVQGDAAGFSDSQREKLAELGLTELSLLAPGEGYMAAADSGNVLFELRDAGEGAEAEDGTLRCSGTASDRSIYVLTSRSRAAVWIDEKEYAPEQTGLYAVVYDCRMGTLLDTALFDGLAGSEPIENAGPEEMPEETVPETEPDPWETYLENRRAQNAALVESGKFGKDGLVDFLKYYRTDDYMIFLVVQEDAAPGLGDSAREELTKLGLKKLGQIAEGDSYVAVINNRSVLTEQCGQGTQPLEYKGEFYALLSAGKDSGSKASIVVFGEPYAEPHRGIHLAVYDKITGTVITTACFDTGEAPPPPPTEATEASTENAE